MNPQISSGFKHSLKEVLQDPGLQSRLTDTKATEEVKALETFYRTLSNDPLRACYGEKHVDLASAAQVIKNNFNNRPFLHLEMRTCN